MKKILCFILAMTLLMIPTTTAEAKKGHNKNNHNHTKEYKIKIKKQKKKYKTKKSPVIKHGKYKLPIAPIEKGMGAKLDYDNKTTVLTVNRGNLTIKIDFKKEIVTINGVIDKDANIFKNKNKNKTIVLVKYIAELLGADVDYEDDDIIVELPGLDYPTNVTVTAVGNTVKKNTLNSTNLYLTASAKIKPGQAVGGKAELYVGSKLVATDHAISARDTKVTFTTSDGSPTNSELRKLIPNGGLVTVRLYNADNQYVTSKLGNPTLIVDYAPPTLTSISTATFNADKGQLILNVKGAGAIGDSVDVTKISFHDPALGKSYRLTNDSRTGSTGHVQSSNTLIINLGSKDKNGLKYFGSSNMYLTIDAGSLLMDSAGNVSPKFTSSKTVPLSYSYKLNPPTNIKIITDGTVVKENVLNSTTLFMEVTANITRGQASGGKAELYVGNKLIATDTVIKDADTTVDFMISDSTPTNEELRKAVPQGGLVTVKLYNAQGNYVVSQTGNPTLVVDYVAPTLKSITDAYYYPEADQIYLKVAGASAVGDTVNVSKISLYDSKLLRTHTLTQHNHSGSKGSVNSETSLIINLGSADRSGLKNFGANDSTVFLTISEGALLIDEAGNQSSEIPAKVLPVTIIR